MKSKIHLFLLIIFSFKIMQGSSHLSDAQAAQNAAKKSFNKDVYYALQVSGIAAGVQKRWPSRLDKGIWSIILSYLYHKPDRAHLPTKLWFDSLVKVPAQMPQEQLDLEKKLSQERVAWAFQSAKAFAGEGSQKVKVVEENGHACAFVYRNKGEATVFKNKKSVVTSLGRAISFYNGSSWLVCSAAELSPDGKLLKIMSEIVKHADGERRCEYVSSVYDVKTQALLSCFTHEFNGLRYLDPNHVFRKDYEAYFFNRDSKLMTTYGNMVGVYDIPPGSPLAHTTLVQRILLHEIDRRYFAKKNPTSDYAKKVSLQEMSKDLEVPLHTIKTVFDSLHPQAQQQVFKTYNVKCESSGCSIQ